MKMLLRAALALSALLACVPAMAQHATISVAPAGYAPEMAPVTLPATSTPLTGAPGVGTTMLGSFVPQLGRDVWILIKNMGTGTITVGTSPATDACATIFNPLTVGGQPWGIYTGNANEYVTTPTRANVVLCVQAAISAAPVSGSISVDLRQ